MPLFSVISDIFPDLKELEENARKNTKTWADFQETEEQKKIYLPKSKEEFNKRWGKVEANISDDEDCTL